MDPETQERFGRFRVLEPLGNASPRDLFLAQDESGVRVVLKVLGSPEPDPRNELTTFASLSHPNLVKVVDLFSEDGRTVIALEQVDGASLNAVRAAFKRASVTLDDASMLYIGAGLMAGVAAAHGARDVRGKAAPVLHRNISPANVLVTWEGVVKLGNFGIADVTTSLRDSSSGFAWSSYGYYAPEHVRQEPIGPSADVYSASIVVWELLTGRRAVEQGALTDAQVLTAMASPKLPSIDQLRPDLDPRVRDALKRGLEVVASRRMIGAGVLRDRLAASVDKDRERQRLAALLAKVRPDMMRNRAASRPGLGRPDSVTLTLQRTTDPLATTAETATAPASDTVIEAATERPTVEVSVPVVPPPTIEAPPVPAVPPVAAPVDGPPGPPPARAAEATVPDSPVAIATRPSSAPAPVVAPRRSWAPWVAGLLVGSLGGLSIAFFALHVWRDPDEVRWTPPPPMTATAAPPPVPEVKVDDGLPAAASASAAPSASASVAVAPPSAPPAPATEPPAPSASTTTTTSDIPPDHGELRFPAWAAGHRVFVDGRVVGDGSKPALLPCGPHQVRIGSAGTNQSVQVACGTSTSMPAH